MVNCAGSLNCAILGVKAIHSISFLLFMLLAEMDSLSNSSLQESNSLNYFPSAVPESPSNQSSQVVNGAFQSLSSASSHHDEKLSVKMDRNSKEMAVIISIGPSREPVPLMRYEFYKSSNKSQGAISEETRHELIIKSKQIQEKFSNLILDICSLLQDSSTAYIEKLQMWLSFQSCSKSVQSLQAFDTDSSTLKAETIPALISSLRCYTSWYNYSLIADIVKQFCANKGAALVSAYEAELKEYLQKLILHCPPLFPDHEFDVSHSQNVELVEVEVGGWEASTAVLEDLALFKHTLCQLCDLDPRFLVIREINTTNFKMLWAVPKPVVGMLTEAIKLNSDALYHKSNVQAVKTADLEIDFKEVSMHKTACTILL